MGVAATSDCNPRFVYLDPYTGAAAAVAEAARNLACVGATPLAITDNLNFGNPHRPEVYYQLERAVHGISDACRALNTPVTGGNVSLYNQYTAGDERVAIHPTPTIGMIGVLPDVNQRATLNLKAAGQTLYLLGYHADSIGASQYLETVHGLEAGQVPLLDLAHEQKVIDGVLALIRTDLTDTAHDCAEGGLAVALAEMAIAGSIGLKVQLDADARLDALLFGENHGRIIVAVSDFVATEAKLKELGVPFIKLGATGGNKVTIVSPERGLYLSVNLETLQHAYETPLQRILG